MTTKYDVWYRDPHEVVKNILASPDFEGQINYVAYREFDGGQRRYGNMMSGDWSWRQSVCFFILDTSDTSSDLRTPPLG